MADPGKSNGGGALTSWAEPRKLSLYSASKQLRIHFRGLNHDNIKEIEPTEVSLIDFNPNLLLTELKKEYIPSSALKQCWLPTKNVISTSFSFQELSQTCTRSCMT